MRFLSKILGVITLLTGFSHAENWPAWRGPNDSGSTTKGPYPADLSNPENLAWKLPLPGKGCSTPIVWENQIFITSPQKDQDTLSAISWEGKVEWSKSIGKERTGKHRNGSGRDYCLTRYGVCRCVPCRCFYSTPLCLPS